MLHLLGFQQLCWLTCTLFSHLALPGLDCDPVAFNALFARDVALPLALAAYTVTGGSPAVLPPGFGLLKRSIATPCDWHGGLTVSAI